MLLFSLGAALAWIAVLATADNFKISNLDEYPLPRDFTKIEFNTKEKFSGTVRDFFEKNYQDVAGFRVPKLNAELARFGYLMASFTGVVGITDEVKNVKKKGGPLVEGGPLICQTGKDCGYLLQKGWTVYKKILGKDLTRTSVNQWGFITIMEEHEAILLYLKGVTEASNLAYAANFRYRDLSELEEKGKKYAIRETKKARVHAGFDEAADEIYASARDNLMLAHAAHPTFTILISGHSMGGAVSSVLSPRLRADAGFRVAAAAKAGMKVFPLANPMVGNEAFAAGLIETFPEMTRSTSADDLVPLLPPKWVQTGDPYTHTPVEVWMLPGKKRISNPWFEWVELPTYRCVGFNNRGCIERYSVPNALMKSPLQHPQDHGQYYGIGLT